MIGDRTSKVTIYVNNKREHLHHCRQCDTKWWHVQMVVVSDQDAEQYRLNHTCKSCGMSVYDREPIDVTVGDLQDDKDLLDAVIEYQIESMRQLRKSFLFALIGDIIGEHPDL